MDRASGGEGAQRTQTRIGAPAAWIACAFGLAGTGVAAGSSCGFREVAPDLPDAGVAGAAGDSGLVLDAGGEIPAPPNGEGLCPPGVCNFQSQEGCPFPQACWPYVDDAGTVFAACADAGTRTSGQACSEWADCARGYACVEEACRRFCCGGDWSACDTDEGCIRQLSLLVGDAAINSGVELCYPVDTCDVLDLSACAFEPGMTCQIVDPRGKTACLPAGSAQLGEPCSTVRVCGAGLSCVGGTCRRLCRAVVGGEPSCPADEGICVHFSRDPEGVGECTVVGD
jgi:hypothetical protein